MPACLFLTLPPELRRDVCDFALFTPRTLYRIRDIENRNPHLTALLRVNHTISAQALESFYSINTFYILLPNSSRPTIAEPTFWVRGRPTNRRKLSQIPKRTDRRPLVHQTLPPMFVHWAYSASLSYVRHLSLHFPENRRTGEPCSPDGIVEHFRRFLIEYGVPATRLQSLRLEFAYCDKTESEVLVLTDVLRKLVESNRTLELELRMITPRKGWDAAKEVMKVLMRRIHANGKWVQGYVDRRVDVEVWSMKRK